jgi:hypothetical protein
MAGPWVTGYGKPLRACLGAASFASNNSQPASQPASNPSAGRPWMGGFEGFERASQAAQPKRGTCYRPTCVIFICSFLGWLSLIIPACTKIKMVPCYGSSGREENKTSSLPIASFEAVYETRGGGSQVEHIS